MLLMKLKSFNFLIGLLIIFFCTPLFSEEKIDIWKNKEKKVKESQNVEKEKTKENSNYAELEQKLLRCKAS